MNLFLIRGSCLMHLSFDLQYGDCVLKMESKD